LESLRTAEELDKAYITSQEKAHDEAVALFEGFSQKGAAAETLPTLKDHQAAVRSLQQ
jgi:putative membrane protein